jgi:hypothetical protein
VAAPRGLSMAGLNLFNLEVACSAGRSPSRACTQLLHTYGGSRMIMIVDAPWQLVMRPSSEKDAKLAQKLGQLQPFIAVFPQECMGQLAYFGPT